jgi:hypothetical protein
MVLDARAGSGNDAIPRSDCQKADHAIVTSMPDISSKVAEEGRDAFPVVSIDRSQGKVYNLKDTACSTLLALCLLILTPLRINFDLKIPHKPFFSPISGTAIS